MLYTHKYILLSMKFINRKEEMCLLRNAVGKNPLIFVYGRRRVGKTRLLWETFKDMRLLYLLCREEELSETLKRLRGKLMEVFGDSEIHARYIKSFDDFFDYISDKECVVIFDEFPVLVKKHPAILGVLQEYLDMKRKAKNTVILCGSSISFMEEIQGYSSPIYGRRSSSLKVKPLQFEDLSDFFPEYSKEELVKIYACFDGIPEYLLRINPENSPEENIIENFFRKGYMYEEAEYLLRYELRDLATYNTILEAIGERGRKFNEIHTITGIDKSKLPKYLSVLQNLGIVSREKPLTAKRKARNYIYRISDNYFRFYYTFIYPYKESIEMDMSYVAIEHFKKHFNTYLGHIFEDIVKQILLKLNKSERLPFKFELIGKWWNRSYEIDLITVNETQKKVIFWEVKWANISYRDAERIYKSLKERAQFVKEYKNYEKYYGIFARKISVVPENVVAFDLRRIYFNLRN